MWVGADGGIIGGGGHSRGGGASDYMCHVPLCVCLSCTPLHAVIGAVASGGNLVGGVPSVAGRCTPHGIGMVGRGMW